MADNISTLLSQVATIAKVSCSSLGMKRVDKDASRQSERAHMAIYGSSTTSVSRLAGAEGKIKEITDDHTEARALVNDNTTAWGERRLLSNNLLEKVMVPFGEIKKRHDEKVNVFIYEAPQLIEKAEENKGTFNVKVPTMDEIRNAFSLEFVLEPVPDIANYRSGNLDKAVEKVLKERFEANMAAAYADAQKDAVSRLANPLEKLVEKLNAYSERESAKNRGMTVDKTGTFRDTIIGNVQDIASVFSEWNLTGDPVLKLLDDQLNAFSNIDADDLRNDANLRSDTAKRAAKILDEIRAGGYL